MTGRMMRILSVVACAALTITPVFAGDGPEGNGNPGNGVCTLDGAWLGSAVSDLYEVNWMVVYDSDSHWTGPFTMEMFGFDASLGGTLPATSLSGFTGTWVRTGRRTFDYTMIAYGLDAAGLPVYIGKNTGSIELTGTCDGGEGYSSSIALYGPMQDPFGEDPPEFGCIPDATILSSQRIPVQPPCEPPPP